MRLREWLGITREVFYDPKQSRFCPWVSAIRALESPGVLPLPHPSPRNNIWLKKNPWFAESLLPVLSKAVNNAIETDRSI